MDNKIEFTLSKVADDLEHGRVFDRPDGRAAIQMELNRLEKWVNRNFVKFSKVICTWERLTPHTSVGWGPTSGKVALQKRT